MVDRFHSDGFQNAEFSKNVRGRLDEEQLRKLARDCQKKLLYYIFLHRVIYIRYALLTLPYILFSLFNKYLIYECLIQKATQDMCEMLMKFEKASEAFYIKIVIYRKLCTNL